MRPPEFWQQPPGLAAALLAPAALLYDMAGVWRRRLTTAWRAPVPVICVGNLVAGGAGKTPTALAIGAQLRANGLNIAFVSRGYGRRSRGTMLVDPARHHAAEVGDEPLLLARLAPTIVAADRKDGARLAIAEGADIVILDDGLQNPSLYQDLRLAVIDGASGFGNGKVIPAGPLREDLARGLARVHGFVLIGEDRFGVLAQLRGAPVLRARLVPDDAARRLGGERVLAFAGIGRPQKFFDTLREIGAEIVQQRSFADHHPYTDRDIAALEDDAARERLMLVTTQKDWVRLPNAARGAVTAVGVTLVFNPPDAAMVLLQPKLAPKRLAESARG
jgi:tetraacyldisaccharide 4'-kinase